MATRLDTCEFRDAVLKEKKFASLTDYASQTCSECDAYKMFKLGQISMLESLREYAERKHLSSIDTLRISYEIGVLKRENTNRKRE